MATKKGGGNRFTNKLERMGNAGGNHPERGKDAILNKGRVSVGERAAKAQGKDTQQHEANRFSRKIEQVQSPASYEDIKAKLDKEKDGKNSLTKEKE